MKSDVVLVRRGPSRTALLRAISAGVARTIAYLIVTVGAISMLVPFLWMLRTSLMKGGQAGLFPPVLVPDPFVWNNYVKIFQQVPLGVMTLNSIKITVMSTFGTLLSSSLCGFGFARLRLRGREVVFLILLLTTMIPRAVTLIPLSSSTPGWVGSTPTIRSSSPPSLVGRLASF